MLAIQVICFCPQCNIEFLIKQPRFCTINFHKRKLPATPTHVNSFIKIISSSSYNKRLHKQERRAIADNLVLHVPPQLISPYMISISITSVTQLAMSINHNTIHVLIFLTQINIIGKMAIRSKFIKISIYTIYYIKDEMKSYTLNILCHL